MHPTTLPPYPTHHNSMQNTENQPQSCPVDKLRTAVYPSRIAPIDIKLCPSEFQAIPAVFLFEDNFNFPAKFSENVSYSTQLGYLIQPWPEYDMGRPRIPRKNHMLL